MKGHTATWNPLTFQCLCVFLWDHLPFSCYHNNETEREWERWSIYEVQYLVSAHVQTHNKTWIVLAEMSLAHGSIFFSLPQFLLFHYSDLTACASPSFLFSHLIYDCQGGAPETHRPSTMSPSCLLMKRLSWLLLEVDMKIMFSLHNQTR